MTSISTAGKGGLIHLGTYAASNVTSVEIGSGLDLDASIDSTYDEYVLVINSLVPATDNVSVNIRTSTDGGTTFDTGASDYEHGSAGFNAESSPTVIRSGDGADTEITLTPNNFIGNAAGENFNAAVKIHSPAEANKTIFGWMCEYTRAAGEAANEQGIGARVSAADVDALRLFLSSGNISSANISLYAIKKG